MTAFFITATGTDIGKTFVATGLIRHMHAAGRPVAAIKPVVSGFDPGAWHGSDPAALLVALGRPAELAEVEHISPWRFKAPLSPHMAARHEGRAIAFQEVVEFCRRSMTKPRGALLIEGIGGIMVPLDDRRTVLDWMSVLRIPIILVAGAQLGTKSPTPTPLEGLGRRNPQVAAGGVGENAGSA